MFTEIIIKFANFLIIGKKAILFRFFFILTFVLPVIFLAVYSFINTYQQTTLEVLEHKKSLAFLASNIVHERLNGLMDFGVSLATRPKLIEAVKNGDWTGGLSVISNLLMNFQFIDRIVLFDTEAFIKAEMPVTIPSMIGQNRSDRKWYQFFKKNWTPYVTGVYKRGAPPLINIISVMLPIKSGTTYYSTDNNQKNRIGILQIQIKLEIFKEWIKNADVGKGGLIYIVDHYGHIVYHPKIDVKEEIVDFSSVYIVQKLLKGLNGAEENYNPVEKEERVAAYVPVLDYGWGIVVTQPVQYAYAERNRHLIYLFFTYLIAIIFTLVIAFYLLYAVIQLKKSYQSLEELSLELKRSNQDLDDFAYIASHDLKEPLRSISNFSSFIMEDYHDKLDKEGLRKLNVLIDQSRRLENFLNALLRYSRVGREKVQAVSINLHEIMNFIKQDLDFQLQENKSATVKIINETDWPEIKSDPVLIKEIFMNLISNGIKYNDKPEKIIRLGFLEEYASHKNVFYIRDNGIGMQEKHFAVIFKIFKRLHGRDKYGGGTGAGLTIVKKMIEALNGYIWVESKPELGSTFYFTLNGGNV